VASRAASTRPRTRPAKPRLKLTCIPGSQSGVRIARISSKGGRHKGLSIDDTRRRGPTLFDEPFDAKLRISQLEAERDAARSGAAIEIAAIEAAVTPLRELADRLTAELADARRPWWRRLVGS